jgi:hypothetical protein
MDLVHIDFFTHPARMTDLSGMERDEYADDNDGYEENETQDYEVTRI